MDGVGTSIVGRPRRLSADRRARPTYTLIWEEPFWWWVLFLWLVSLVAGILDHVTNLGFDDTHTFARVQYGGWITLVAVLILAIPTLAVTVRRLHDAGSSGWWVLMYFICCLGALALYIMCLRGSQSGANKYGPPPGVTA